MTMKMKMRTKFALFALVAIVVSFASASIASAAAPPFEPDPNSIGALQFFDAAGNPVIGGNINDAPFAAYVQATVAGRAGDTKATLFGYLPKNGIATGAWSGEALTASSTYPNASAPAPLNGSLPLVALSSQDETIAGLIGDLPNTATDSYQGLYQLRVKTSGTAPPDATYDSADILVNGNTWSLVYPAPVAQSTTTTLDVAPTSPQVAGTSIGLTAHVAPASASGSVQFLDGASPIGSPVAVAGGTAQTSSSSLTAGSHSLTAAFTATNPGAFGDSTSAATPFTITQPSAVVTTTALSVNTGTGVGFSPVGLTATVTPSNAAGKVTFTDGAAVVGTTAAGSGTFSLTTSALAPGSHTITATFNPTSSAAFTSSQATGTAFDLTQPAIAPANANVQAAIAPGTLVISTPYTPNNPIDLGTLALNDNATQYSASVGVNGITVTDTRSGDLPWAVSALATPLSNGGPGTIDPQNLGLTNIVPVPVAGNSLTAASVVGTDNPAASPAVAAGAPGSLGLGGGSAHVVLSAGHGIGSIGFNGLLTLNAPSSSPPGTYKGTITLTVG